jgi:ferredoxin
MTRLALNSWVLALDGTRCDGHGICALHCPDLVTLDEWGYAGVERSVIDSRALMRRARRAVAACPERALSLRLAGGRHAPSGKPPEPRVSTDLGLRAQLGP